MGLGYVANSNSATILAYSGSNSTVTIPATLGGRPVTSICDNAFTNQSGITTVIIPNTVTNLGNSVFSGCNNLTSISIPDSVMQFGTNISKGSPTWR